MGDILILFASTSGNTEDIAETIADYLEDDHDYKVEVKSFDLDPIDVKEIFDYDAVLIGTHTWDDGELPYEIEDFYTELGDVDITGVPIGVFGAADSFYDSYGGAIDLIGDRVQNLGADLFPERMKVDFDMDGDYEERSCEYAEMVNTALQNRVKSEGN